MDVSGRWRAERMMVPNIVRSHHLCRLCINIEIGLSGFGPGPNPCRSTHRWPLIRQVLASATVGCPLPKVSEHLAEYFKRDAFPPLTPP